jgi:hypothetical protein
VANLKQFAKVADDPKKRRKLVRRKVPEGMVPWSETTMTRLVQAAPEPLKSNMRVSTAMILDVVDRPGDPFESMRRLLTDNHEPRKRQLGSSARRSASPAHCCRPVSSNASRVAIGDATG